MLFSENECIIPLFFQIGFLKGHCLQFNRIQNTLLSTPWANYCLNYGETIFLITFGTGLISGLFALLFIFEIFSSIINFIKLLSNFLYQLCPKFWRKLAEIMVYLFILYNVIYWIYLFFFEEED